MYSTVQGAPGQITPGQITPGQITPGQKKEETSALYNLGVGLLVLFVLYCMYYITTLFTSAASTVEQVLVSSNQAQQAALLASEATTPQQAAEYAQLSTKSAVEADTIASEAALNAAELREQVTSSIEQATEGGLVMPSEQEKAKLLEEELAAAEAEAEAAAAMRAAEEAESAAESANEAATAKEAADVSMDVENDALNEGATEEEAAKKATEAAVKTCKAGEMLYENECVARKSAVWGWTRDKIGDKTSYGVYKNVDNEWIRVPGGFINISSSGNGSFVRGVNGPYHAWNYNYDTKKNEKMDERIKQVDVDCDGNTLGIDRDGKIMEYRNNKFENANSPGDIKFMHVTNGGGKAYAIATDRTIYERKNGEWTTPTGSGARLEFIDTGCDGETWGVNRAHSVWGGGSNGNVYKLNNGDITKWTNYTNGRQLSTIKVGPNNIWGTTIEGDMYKCSKPCTGDWFKEDTRPGTWQQVG